jgi:hypothetical protein
MVHAQTRLGLLSQFCLWPREPRTRTVRTLSEFSLNSVQILSARQILKRNFHHQRLSARALTGEPSLAPKGGFPVLKKDSETAAKEEKWTDFREPCKRHGESDRPFGQ